MADENFYGKRRKTEEETEENSSDTDLNADSTFVLSNLVDDDDDEQLTLPGILSLLSFLVLSNQVYDEITQVVQLCIWSTLFSIHVQRLPWWNPAKNEFDIVLGHNDKKVYCIDLCMKVPFDHLQKLLPEDKVLDTLEMQLSLNNTKFCSSRHVFDNKPGLNFRVPVRCDPEKLQEIIGHLTWKLQFLTAHGSAGFQMMIAGNSFCQFHDGQLLQMTLGHINKINCDHRPVPIDVLAWVRRSSIRSALGYDFQELPTWVPQNSCLRQMHESMREFPVTVVKPGPKIIDL